MTNETKTHRGFGVVLDPVQFAAELASLRQRPQYQGRALYVKLPDAVLRTFESAFVPVGHSVAISGGEALPVAAISLQAAGTQVVCLVPLATPEACAWLIDSVEQQRRFYVAVSITGRNQLIVMQAQTPVRDLSDPAWLKVKEHLAGKRQGDTSAELADVLNVVRFVEQDSDSDVPGFEVQERWVFVCVPHDELAGAETSTHGQAPGEVMATVH